VASLADAFKAKSLHDRASSSGDKAPIVDNFLP
jgi:hypothetical protein